MSRVLLAGINARYTHSNPALLYLKKSIAGTGNEAVVREYTISALPEEIINDVLKFSPDILALSVYIWNSTLVRMILRLAERELPGIKIILGGPEVSFNPEEWIKAFPSIGHIITGGGEEAFRRLVLSETGCNGKIIPGCNPLFSEIEFPYNNDDMERLAGKYIYYESSRGCPFRCSYCLSSLHGGNVEYRTLQQVREELSFLASFRPKLIKFIDRTFNLKKEHYRFVWEFIADKLADSGVCFHFEIFPELLDDDDLKFLAGIPRGLFQFEMGIQSTDIRVLVAINRKGNWERASKNIRELSASGNIHLHTDLIAGLPYQDFRSFGCSFNDVYNAGAEHLQCGYLKVLPGTEMKRQAEEYGMTYNPLPPYEVVETAWMNEDELKTLKKTGELVDLIHNSGRFVETSRYLAELYGDPFSFYTRAAESFVKDENASHRGWDNIAGLLLDLTGRDYPDFLSVLTDTLRWDWCVSMKHHHFPPFLKSDDTVYAKKAGILFFTGLSENGVILYKGETFPLEELRRSLFFSPVTAEFRERVMNDEMALFLPDKRIVFFNPLQS